jgi:hypothetical protein
MEVSRLFMPDNNCIEQDHRAIKRRVRPMLGFKSVDSARVILGGIELIHMMRKGQAKYACNQQPTSGRAVRVACCLNALRSDWPFRVVSPGLRHTRHEASLTLVRLAPETVASLF